MRYSVLCERNQSECAEALGVSRTYYQELELKTLHKVYRLLLEEAAKDKDFSKHDLDMFRSDAFSMVQRMKALIKRTDMQDYKQRKIAKERMKARQEKEREAAMTAENICRCGELVKTAREIEKGQECQSQKSI